jgi:hypothetical protein
VPTLQRWVNDKQFDGGSSTLEEKELRDFYKRLLNFTINSSALTENYQDIHKFNRSHTEWYNDHVLSFVRWSNTEKLIIISNFNQKDTFGFELQIPEDIIGKWNLKDVNYEVSDQLYNSYNSILKVEDKRGKVRIDIGPLESYILTIK